MHRTIHTISFLQVVYSPDEQGEKSSKKVHSSEAELYIYIYIYIEVRDSRTGYFIPVRYGLGLLPDGIVVGAPPPSASSGSSGRLSGQGTIFEVFDMVLGSW